MICEACAHTNAQGWHGIDGAAHCHDCHMTWTSKRAAHCPGCCCHFTSYSAADLHDGPNGCIPPAEVESLRLAADGFSWRRADEHTSAKSASGSGVLASAASAPVPVTQAAHQPLNAAKADPNSRPSPKPGDLTSSAFEG